MLTITDFLQWEADFNIPASNFLASFKMPEFAHYHAFLTYCCDSESQPSPLRCLRWPVTPDMKCNLAPGLWWYFWTGVVYSRSFLLLQRNTTRVVNITWKRQNKYGKNCPWLTRINKKDIDCGWKIHSQDRKGYNEFISTGVCSERIDVKTGL